MRARSRCNSISVVRERSVFVRSVSRENGRVIKSIGAPASGEGSEPGLGFRARWRRRGDVRIIDIRGADERARQPTGGKGPRITSGGPYSPWRSDQTCVHPVLSVACSRAAKTRQELRVFSSRSEEKKKKREKRERDEEAGNLSMRKKLTRFLDSALRYRRVDNSLLKCNFKVI